MTHDITVDDFREFLTDAYRDTLTAFTRHGLTATIEAGAVGHYLLVVEPAQAPQVGLVTTVEVTAGGRPLPPRPADVAEWVATAGERKVTVTNMGPESLAEAIIALG